MTSGGRRTNGPRWPVMAVAVLALAATGVADAGPVDLVRHPPRVESIAVQLIDPPAPRARLFVEYAPNERLGPRIVLDFGNEAVVLRDDGRTGDEKAGDRRYTGVFTFDVRALREQWERLGRLTASEHLTMPVFSGRVIVGEHLVKRVHPKLLVTALLRRKRVGIDRAVCSVQPIDWAKSLMITDPTVVRDLARTFDRCAAPGSQGTPSGTWSFPYLIGQAAGPGVSNATVSQFIKTWLQHWQTAQTVNGWPVAARTKIDAHIIGPWRDASKGSGVEFDPAQAPFRLLAIVNRIDQSDSLIYDTSSAPDPGNAGELRFVFGALSKACVPLDFTVIFEYAVHRTDCQGIAAWARDWIKLSQLPFGATSYNPQLELLTEQIVKHGSAPWRSNKSLLDQVRTNEFSLEDPAGGATWELREFRLSATNQLVQATVERTPDASLNGSTTLRDYVNANSTPIEKEQHDVPADWPAGQHFLGGSALAEPQLLFWDAPGISKANARFRFSLNTCSGCHVRETGTASMHINPKIPAGGAGQLSPFLTGGAGATVTDPVDGTTHVFGDLARRTGELARAATLPCVCQLLHLPIVGPH